MTGRSQKHGEPVSLPYGETPGCHTSGASRTFRHGKWTDWLRSRPFGLAALSRDHSQEPGSKQSQNGALFPACLHTCKAGAEGPFPLTSPGFPPMVRKAGPRHCITPAGQAAWEPTRTRLSWREKGKGPREARSTGCPLCLQGSCFSSLNGHVKTAGHGASGLGI